MKIQVFDPPMCCSTGVCGPTVDPKLVRFAADLDWLKRQGVDVERYNLTQQPAAFAGNEVVRSALAKDGDDCLPLTLVDDAVVCKGDYPTRAALAGYAGLESGSGIGTDAVKEPAERSLCAPVAKVAPCCCEPSTVDILSAPKTTGKRPCC
jgi:hypothetical protein